MGQKRSSCRVLVGKPEGKTPLGTPRPGWVENFKWISENCDMRAWIEFVWLRIRKSGGIL
jgi:hypothetical protein